MNQNFDDKDIQDALMASLSMTEPSDDLTRKLRVLAKETARPKKTWWRQGIALAGTVAAATAVVALSLAPSKASAKSFDMLVSAAQQIHSFQLSITSQEGGQKTPFTIAGIDGRFVMRADDGLIMQFNDGSLQFYEPKANTVTKFSLSPFIDTKQIAQQAKQGMSEALKGVDLKKMLKDYQDQYGKDHIKISTVQGGAYFVDMQAPNEPQRVHMTVEASSDLPTQVLVQKKSATGAWEENVRIDMKYGQKVDPAFLKASFPANAKRVSMDLGNMIGDAMKQVSSLGNEIKKFTAEPKPGK